MTNDTVFIIEDGMGFSDIVAPEKEAYSFNVRLCDKLWEASFWRVDLLRRLKHEREDGFTIEITCNSSDGKLVATIEKRLQAGSETINHFVVHESIVELASQALSIEFSERQACGSTWYSDYSLGDERDYQFWYANFSNGSSGKMHWSNRHNEEDSNVGRYHLEYYSKNKDTEYTIKLNGHDGTLDSRSFEENALRCLNAVSLILPANDEDKFNEGYQQGRNSLKAEIINL